MPAGESDPSTRRPHTHSPRQGRQQHRAFATDAAFKPASATSGLLEHGGSGGSPRSPTIGGRAFSQRSLPPLAFPKDESLFREMHDPARRSRSPRPRPPRTANDGLGRTGLPSPRLAHELSAERLAVEHLARPHTTSYVPTSGDASPFGVVGENVSARERGSYMRMMGRMHELERQNERITQRANDLAHATHCLKNGEYHPTSVVVELEQHACYVEAERTRALEAQRASLQLAEETKAELVEQRRAVSQVRGHLHAAQQHRGSAPRAHR